jgi:hypothetical protein
LDYANNRYYSNVYGRFMTPDPYMASGGPGDPKSWNRYTYTRGDPVNRYDPAGMDDSIPTFTDTVWDYTDDYLDYPGATPNELMSCMQDPGCYSSQMGSSGLTPAAAHITPLIAPGTNQDQQQALDAGIDSAWAHLISHPNCLSFLTGNSGEGYVAALMQLSNILMNTTYTFAPLPSGTGAETFSVNQVTISTSGSFFSPPTLGNVVFVQLPNPQGEQIQVGFSSVAMNQAFLLLHELGHQTGVLPADEDDAQNGTNSANILTNCFTKNALGIYQ